MQQTVETRVRQFRIDNLQWALAALCAVTGALMLITPHLFPVSLYGLLASNLALAGALFLVAGLAFVSVCALPTPTWLCAVAHALGSGGLLTVATSFFSTRHWALGAALAAVAAVTAGAIVMHRRLQVPEEGGDADILPLALATANLAIALVLIAGRGALPAGIPGLLVALWPLPGLLIGASGAALAVVQFRRVRARRFVYLVAGVLLFAVALAVALPTGNRPGVFYGLGGGLLLILYPRLGRYLQSFDPRSLYTRLVLLLALTAAVPIVIIVALASEEQESSTREQVLLGQRNLAGSIAQNVGEYVDLHGRALETLAAQPGLMDLSPADQRRLLQIYARIYPDVLSFALFRADGSQIVRSDDLPPDVSIAGYPNFEIPRATGELTMNLLVSPVVGRPVAGFGAPVMGPNGEFLGLVSTALESSTLAAFLAQESRQSMSTIYLVDDLGRAIAHPDPGLVAEFADLSARPAVAHALAAREEAGFMTYDAPQGMQLVAYAHAPGVRWHVLIERPERDALGSVHAARELALGVLVVTLGMVALAGIIIARHLTEPLMALSDAADELAAGSPDAPLPASGFVEIQSLSTAFAEMRDRLVERTSERERAREQLLALSHRLLEVQESERRTIARELHDEAGQALTALTVGLGLLQRGDVSPDQAARIEELKKTADEVMEGLHNLAANLRPASLDRAGLVPALRQHVEAINRRNGLRVDLVATGFGGDGSVVRLSPDVEVNLYRVVQEALTNVLRHANATVASVVLERRSHSVLAIIEDNGTGFDVERAQEEGRLGIFGMHERVGMLGGHLTIESIPGSGTSVFAEVPLDPGAGSDPGV